MWPNGDQGTRLHPEVLPPQRTAKLLVGLVVLASCATPRCN
jgi:hypothetical protein